MWYERDAVKKSAAQKPGSESELTDQRIGKDLEALVCAALALNTSRSA